MALDTQDIILFVKKHPVGVGCAAIAILLGVGTYVRAGSMGELETRLDEVSREGDRYKNNLRYAARLDEHVAVVEKAADEISSHAINPSSLATNLQYFYRLESELGLKLIDLRQGTPDRPAAGQNYVPVPYTVAVEGTYRQLMDFIRHLEGGQLYVRFLSSNMSPSRDPNRGPQAEPRIVLSMNLQVLGRA